MRLTLIGMMGLMGLMALPTSALARPGRGGHGPGMGVGILMRDPHFVEAYAKQLGLKDWQVKKIKDLVYNTQKKTIPLRAKMQSARLDLRRLMDADKPDRNKVLKQLEVVGGIEIQLKKSHIGLLLSVRSQLTREQRTKLLQLIKERRGKRWRHFKGRGHGRGKGGPGGGRGFGPGPR